MYCVNCGAQLPDDANFCSKCGKPQKQGLSEPVWETCDIVWSVAEKGGWRKRATLYYWAKATGPNGTYTVAESDVIEGSIPQFDSYWPDKDRARHKEQVDKLTSILISKGWEFVETFGAPYQKRFRRKVG